MSHRTTHDDVLEAAELLPEGATLVIPEFEWDEYERLLEDLQDAPHLRLSYDRGRLQIVSISSEHEDYATAIESLVFAYCDESDIAVEARGRETWRRQTLARGAEADACYYLRNAQRIIGKRRIDLTEDPPPDLVIEIDLTSEARQKFPIYAALGVAEIWRYDGKALQFYELCNGEYTEATGSGLLPGLSGALLAECLNISKTEGQTAARKHLRRRL